MTDFRCIFVAYLLRESKISAIFTAGTGRFSIPSKQIEESRMGRKKKELKVKEPVKIRERKLKGGSTSLYLDIYVNGVRKYEALGLFLVPSSQPDAKMINARARSVAEKIKSDRILALQQRGIKEWDKIKKSKMALIEWLKQYEQDSFGFKESTLKGRRDLRKKMEEYLDSKGLSHIAMSEVDPDFCRGFLKYLDTARNSVCTKQKDRIISKGCAHHHQAVFVGALNKAVRDGIIPQNPFKRLDRREKFHPAPETSQEGLYFLLFHRPASQRCALIDLGEDPYHAGWRDDVCPYGNAEDPEAGKRPVVLDGSPVSSRTEGSGNAGVQSSRQRRNDKLPYQEVGEERRDRQDHFVPLQPPYFCDDDAHPRS